MQRNKELARYDFRNNDLKDAGKCANLMTLVAVIFFTDMLGPDTDESGEPTDKISHVTEIEISERSRGKKLTEEGPPPVYTTYIKLFKD